MTYPPTPDDAKRKLRRFVARIGSILGKRIATGAVRDLDALYAAAETSCEAIIGSTPKVRGLVLAAHNLPRDAEVQVVLLMVSDVVMAIQRFGADIRGWPGFLVHDPRTWPRRGA